MLLGAIWVRFKDLIVYSTYCCTAFDVCLYLWIITSCVGYKSVCQGKIYTASEALEMGLVDSIVEDNNDMDAAVVAECERWIASPGFPATKEQLHRPGLEAMLKNRHMETDLFVTRILSSQTQELLGNYLESLKKK